MTITNIMDLMLNLGAYRPLSENRYRYISVLTTVFAPVYVSEQFLNGT